MENVVSFTLLGKRETLRTTIEQSRVQAIADIVTDKIEKAAARRNMRPSEAFGMIAAFEIAADFYQLRQDYEHLVSLAEIEDE